MFSRRSGAAAVAALVLASAGGAHAAQAGVADAAKAGDLAQVTALLKAGGAVDAADSNGATALTWASHNRNAAMVRTLIEAGASPNVVNDYGFGPLIVAAQEGDAEILRALLAARADPNLATWNGETPLMHAARTGAVEAIETLVKGGAKLDAREGRDGQTALMWAAASGHAEAVRALLAAGADASLKTPVLEVGYPVDRAEETLIRFKKGGFSALHFAVASRNAATVKVLLDSGQDPNQATADDSTPLLLALFHHINPQSGFPLITEIVADLDTVELLLSRGADPNRGDVVGITPLAAAAFVAHGHDIMGSLAGQPLVVKSHDEMGEKAAAMLLAKGADPNLRVRDYRVPSPAGQDPRTIGHYADASPVLLAAVFNKPALLKMMLGSGRAKLDDRGKDGGTPLISAVKLNSLAGVQALVAAGADVNAVDSKGDTPLHIAALGRPGTGAMAKILLDAGARLDIKNRDGQTAVDIARGEVVSERRIDGGETVELTFSESVIQSRGLPTLAGPSAKPVILAKAAGKPFTPDMVRATVNMPGARANTQVATAAGADE